VTPYLTKLRSPRRHFARNVCALVAAATIVAAACGGGSSTKSPTAAGIAAQDVATKAGVATASETHGEDCVADFDGDGVPDVLLSTHANPWPLMRGRADGSFVPYYKGLDPLHADRHGCAVADFNGDGRLDVYIAIGACKGTCKTHKELWIQQPNHTFVNEAAKWGVDVSSDRGRVPVVVNANGDKLPDLFVGAEAGVKYPSFSRLWINKGDHFVLQRGPITNTIGNLCARAADIDGDGIDEIAVCTPNNGFYIYRHDANGIYRVATGDFGVASYGRRNVQFADVNGDGRPDMATITRTQVQLFLNVGGKYPAKPVFSRTVTDGIDVAFGDVDGDGDLDMYVQTGGTRPDQIFLNDGGGTKWAPSVQLPATDKGGGDSVVTISDYKGTHRAAFLVNNGFQDTPGPRQLWEFSAK
jgi:VCBS repeat protein